MEEINKDLEQLSQNHDNVNAEYDVLTERLDNMVDEIIAKINTATSRHISDEQEESENNHDNEVDSE